MRAAAIIAALGIALIVSMGPSPASAQTTVVRECGGQYVVTRYNSDGTVKGVWNKQLSDAGTIYTAGKTWKLVEGDPDRFVSDGGAQLQVVACDAALGSSTRGVQQQGAQGTQTSTTLVRNTHLAGATSVNASQSQRAQAFTTGSNALGYKLTSVKVKLKKASATIGNLWVSINQNSSGVPGTELGRPATSESLDIINFRDVVLSASGGGIDLDANETYFLVINNASAVQIGTQQNNGESGAAGWSIADNRLNGGPSWSTTNTSTFSVVLEVVGYAKTATVTPPPTTTTPPPRFTSGDDGRRVAPGPWISPRVNRADLSGKTVTVSMDKAVRLDDANYTLAQLADKFTVWVNGDRQAVVGASVSGYRVELDLGSSFEAPAGARVAVNYARGPLLDDATGNTVGGFSLSPGPWTTPRPNRVYGTATGVVVSMDKPVQLDSDYSDSRIKAAFTVRVNGTAYEPTGVSVSGRDISLEIESPPADGDKLDVDYTKGPLQDSTGMRILGFAYFGAGR